MNKKANLLLTDTYFNIFNLLKERLSHGCNGIKKNTMIFCEEKISLMTERVLCEALGGTFSVEVVSFGKFLRRKKSLEGVLSKEGASMVIKRVLSTTNLKCFSSNRQNLAPSLYELIIQLKSAKVTPEDIVTDGLDDGVLKNKLGDIATVYREYEQFLKENNFTDQNETLNCLPQIILDDEQMENTDVILLGYTSWTRQARDSVSALLQKAKSVTAILTGGENPHLYLNETSNAFIQLCTENKIEVNKSFIATNCQTENKIILQNLFSPKAFSATTFNTDKISLNVATQIDEEVLSVAKSIKTAVVKEGLKYSDFALSIGNLNGYMGTIERYFNMLEIPYFIDVKRKVENHPLISLITSYIDCFRRSLLRNELIAFFKNPLVCEDKSFADAFENYLIKYNVNYSKIKNPFVYTEKEEMGLEFEKFRQFICTLFEDFNVYSLIKKLNVEGKLQALGEKIALMGESELSAVNKQVYDYVISILEQMQAILGQSKLSYLEFKKVFLSGISSLELSILPQYNDAVFIGGYKESALALTKRLYMLGLDDSAPQKQEDVAILNDNDITKLATVKVMVEPKIRVVNDRVKENAGLATSSFSDKLYLSYTLFTDGDKPNAKSEIITNLERLFTVKKFSFDNALDDGYLTKAEGLLTFSKSCGDFASGSLDDFSVASSFYNLNAKDSVVTDILQQANNEIKIKLSLENRSVISKLVSPTTIEGYYACPYKEFASHYLKISEKEVGQLTPLSVGNFIHEVLEKFILRLDEITSDDLFEPVFTDVLNAVLQKDEYSKYHQEKDSSFGLKRLSLESKKTCNKIYNQFKNSLFKPYKVEAVFDVGEVGKDCDFPAIELLPNVKLKGKIDRIDTYNDYYRVIDYKTGGTDITNKSLFLGLKLQLHLYSKVISNKTLAGAYYMPVNDNFNGADKKPSATLLGKTLDDLEAVSAQDVSFNKDGKSQLINVALKKDKTLTKALSQKTMEAFSEYALRVSKVAAEQMTDGVIVASPDLNACSYCKFKGLCGGQVTECRTVGEIDDTTIEQSVWGENQDA